MGFSSGERDDFTEVSGESRDQWCNPQIKLVPTSSLDGVELIQGGSEPSLLPWKHCGVNPSGVFHGEKESGILECSPLSRWDPNEQRELV